MELQGDNDFSAIFPSVAEEIKEEEERKQTEMFLRLLDDIDTRTNNRQEEEFRKHSLPRKRRQRYRYSDEYDSCSDGDDDVYYSDNDLPPRRRRSHGRRSRATYPAKEYLKVSITDDEKQRREKERIAREEEQQRAALRGKVHTLDDLPPDEMDLAQLFGVAPMPDPPEVNVTAGRRLHDGKLVYSASFPNLADFGIDLGSFTFQLEYIIVFVMVVFMIGIFLGRRASAARHRREIKTITKSHMNQLQSIKDQIAIYTTRQHEQTQRQQQQPQQPIYVPVPMGWGAGTGGQAVASEPQTTQT